MEKIYIWLFVIVYSEKKLLLLSNLLKKLDAIYI